VGLFTGSGNSERDACCRALAHHHGLDYWTEVPRTLHQPQPDSPEWCERRAGHVTMVLEEILRQPKPPAKIHSLL
jgi:hypothetical protein